MWLKGQQPTRPDPRHPAAITAASSSVGIAAIQIANLLGATPVAITRTGAKAARLVDLGARGVVATDRGDVRRQLREAAGGSEVRIVLDAVGGPLIGDIAEAMANGGQIFEYGGLSSEATPFPLSAALGKQLVMRGYLVHHVTCHADRLKRAKDFVLEGVRTGGLRPVVDKVFPFEGVAKAHQHPRSGQPDRKGRPRTLRGPALVIPAPHPDLQSRTRRRMATAHRYLTAI